MSPARDVAGWFRHTEAVRNRSLNHGDYGTAWRIRAPSRVDAALLPPRARKHLDVIMAVESLVAGGCPKDAAIASPGVKRGAHRRRGPNRLEPKSAQPMRRANWCRWTT